MRWERQREGGEERRKRERERERERERLRQLGVEARVATL